MSSELSDNEIKLLNEAFYHEMTNSAIYNIISSWLNSGGLVNLSKYYKEWAEEEYSHGQMVKDFMESIDLLIEPGMIDASKANMDTSTITFIGMTREREVLTTELYQKMLELSLSLNKPLSGLVLEFARKMLAEQIEEMDKANTLYTQVSNMGGNWALLQLLDNSFKS